MSQPNSQFQLSSDQQDLLMAALNSNQQHRNSSPQQSYLKNSSSTTNLYDSPGQQMPGSGQLDFDNDESPYLEFDGEFDDSYDFDLNGQDMIGDIPDGGSAGAQRKGSTEKDGELHDKRKSVDGKGDEEQGDAKRREGDDKTAKKPGRKPLTSEPTTKRKAQNRAAQRAFRDRKEKHLKDLETKVDDLTKVSEATNHENGMLKAQVERLQVELKEYRKRLSWASNSGPARNPTFGSGASNTLSQSKVTNNNDFQFEFPKFGDLPVNPFNGNNSLPKSNQTGAPNRASSLPNSQSKKQASTNSFSPKGVAPSNGSTGTSPQIRQTTSPTSIAGTQQSVSNNAIDTFSGLFSPSTLEASKNFEYFPTSTADVNRETRMSTSSGGGMGNQVPGLYSTSSASNTDSPSNSSESQRAASSMGTSPEPSLNSPSGSKLNDLGLNTINEEGQFPQGTSFGSNVSNTGNDWNWLVQQNGGNFDPVLFGDYRDPQDAVISQDFGSFFNEAFPLPDLGSPMHNFNEVVSPSAVQQQQPPSQPAPVQAPAKVDLMKKVEAAQNGEEQVGEDRTKMMTCNKIWDRLQSMEKFRNGEIDVDNLCSELRAKARCSEGGAVVDKQDVDNILGTAL